MSWRSEDWTLSPPRARATVQRAVWCRVVGRSRRVFAASTRDRRAGGVVASSSLTARGPLSRRTACRARSTVSSSSPWRDRNRRVVVRAARARGERRRADRTARARLRPRHQGVVRSSEDLCVARRKELAPRTHHCSSPRATSCWVCSSSSSPLSLHWISRSRRRRVRQARVPRREDVRHVCQDAASSPLSVVSGGVGVFTVTQRERTAVARPSLSRP